MIRLFLENIEVELDESVSFAINKQFEDITSPTDIKNDWSKTIQIPFTQHNNKLFGELFNVDRLIVEGDNTLMGIYFDPYKKVNFRLQWGNAILLSGYAKNIDVVKESNGTGHYNITLNGELGKVFQEMKKITFDNTTSDTKYLIDGSKYVDETINKDLVYTLWNNEPTYSPTLTENYYYVFDANTGESIKKPNLGYRLVDYIGFVPNNSYDDDFDYKVFQLNNQNSSKTFAEVLDEKARAVGNGKDDDGNGEVDDKDDNYQTVVGIPAETVIGEGLLPREIAEYRSYLQIPYIHFNKLFQIFAKKTTEITGYDVDMNTGWFNDRNPYWSKMVYILQRLSQNTNSKVYESVLKNITFGNFTLTDSYNNYYSPRMSSHAANITWKSILSNSTFLQNVRADFKQNKFDNISFNQTIPVKLSFNNIYYDDVLATQNYIIFAGGYFININFRLKDENGNVVFTNIPVYLHHPSTTNFKGIDVPVTGIPKKSAGQYEITVDIPFNMIIDRNTVGNDFDIEAAVYSSDIYSRTDDTILYLVDSTSGGDIYRAVAKTITVGPLDTEISVTTSNNKRSNSRFTLNDLWNNEFNPFDEILNYCKQFRIGVFCDDINKKLIFKPLSAYFSDYQVLDWTDKLDTSKEYHIQPITFDKKYVLFNYEKYETELNKQYNDKYGVNFGEYRLTTDYEFNNDEKELFKYSKVAIPSTDMCVSWENLYTNLSVIYTLPAEITAYNKDKDEKNVNVFGSMLFYKGLADFDRTSGLRTVSITDDTDFQVFNHTYFYTQNGQEGKYIKTYKYPVLDIVKDDNLCTFTTPSENYTYVPNAYNNKNGIYKNFWEHYLNERYNKQNKIVTCYLRLTPYDFAQFQYNNFVKIQNQLYMVNKIYDYHIDENVPTKVDLVTIQDIKGYTLAKTFEIFELYNNKGQEWSYYRDYITLTSVGQTQTVYITSSKPVTWVDENSALQDMVIYYNNDVSTAMRGSGTIPAGEYIPVTFKMMDNEDQFGDVVFTSEGKEYRVSTALIKDESFTIYDTDKTAWSSTDKIELENTGPVTKTIYITSPNADVEWSANDNRLQDFYIDGKAGSGTIPAGTLVPVTITYDFSESEMLEMPITSSIRFYTAKQSIDVNVEIIIWEIFNLYRWDGELWDENDGYIDLAPDNQKQVLYLDANSDVEWIYVDSNGNPSADLQGLGICPSEDGDWDWGSYDWSGRGMIYPPSNYRPIYFGIDTSLVQGRNEGRVEFYNGRHSWYVDVVLRDS